MNGVSYGYAFDSIGNRLSSSSSSGAEDGTAALEESSGVASSTEYTTNQLNQYTRIVEDDEGVFLPEFDADGNQTRVQYLQRCVYSYFKAKVNTVHSFSAARGIAQKPALTRRSIELLLCKRGSKH